MKRFIWITSVLVSVCLGSSNALAKSVVENFEGYQSWQEMETCGWYNWGSTFAQGSIVDGEGFEGGKAFKSKSLIADGGSANYTFTFEPQDWSDYDYLSLKYLNPGVNYDVGQHLNIIVRDSEWAIVSQTGWNYNVDGDGEWVELRIYIDDSNSWTAVKGLEIQTQQYYLGDELILDDIVLMPRQPELFECFENYTSWDEMKTGGWHNWNEAGATGFLAISEGVDGSKAFKSTSLISDGGSANYTFDFGQQDWTNYESVSVKVRNTGINSFAGQHVNFRILNSSWELIQQTDWQWNVSGDGLWQELEISIDGSVAWQDAAIVELQTNQYGLGDELLFDDIKLLPKSSLVRTVALDSDLSLNENGGHFEYDIYLVKAPSDNVQVQVVPSSSKVDLGAGAGQLLTLEFTPSNYYQAQRIVAVGIDDSVQDGNGVIILSHTITSNDTEYANAVLGDIVLDIIDDDVPTRKVIDGFENYADTAAMQSAWVPVNNSDTVLRRLVEGDPNVCSGNKALEWKFEAGQSCDWWVWSECEFDTAQDWRTFENGALKFRYKATEVNPSFPVKLALYIYNAAGTLVYPFETALTVTDDWQECKVNIPQDNWTGLGLDGYADIKKLRLGVCHEGWLEATFNVDDIVLYKHGGLFTESYGDTTVNEKNETIDSYKLELASKPESDVVVKVSTDGQVLVNTGGGYVQNAEFTLTTTDWVDGRRIFVKAVDDDVLEGDLVSVISHVTQSVDSQYDGYDLGEITVTVLDDECGAWGYLDSDLNKDCHVDIQDVAKVAADWQIDNFIPGSENAVNDFEDYASQAELDSNWSSYYNQTGNSELNLITDPAKAHSGSQAIQWDYDLTTVPVNGGMSEIVYELDSPVNLSEYNQFSLWMYRQGENSQEYILYVKFLDGAGNTNDNISGEKWITIEEGSTYGDPNEWVEWNIDLHDLHYEQSTGVSNGYDELSDITDVRALVFGTYSGSIGGEMGSGTITFDDFKLAVLPVCTAPLNGDVNTDCKVDITDLNMLANEWIDCTEPYLEDCLNLN